MSADERTRGLLDRFLAARGMTREMLLSAVRDVFGPSLLVVATGSWRSVIS